MKTRILSLIRLSLMGFAWMTASARSKPTRFWIIMDNPGPCAALIVFPAASHVYQQTGLLRGSRYHSVH
jgi:hypothetical protein